MLITVRAEIVKTINRPLYLFGSGPLQAHAGVHQHKF